MYSKEIECVYITYSTFLDTAYFNSLILIAGDSSTMHKFAAAYRNIFFPKPVKPPFLHVCQVGDPVLRSKALPVPPEDIPKPETKQV